MIAEFCARFQAPEIPHVRIGKRFFHDPLGLRREGWDTFSVGLFLGEDRQRFRPTSALIELIAPHVVRRIVVNEKTAWLFLCGKDVLGEGILETDDYDKDELAIVADAEGNVLGYGKIVSPRARNDNDLVVKNILDKGEYLRREN